MNKQRRADIYYQMRKNTTDGIHTMNACKCGRGKRGGTEACVCCLADMLREVEKETSNETN